MSDWRWRVHVGLDQVPWWLGLANLGLLLARVVAGAWGLTLALYSPHSWQRTLGGALVALVCAVQVTVEREPKEPLWQSDPPSPPP